MQSIAFYAPLKPPSHPVPSGDREFARSLIAAINTDGVRVDLVSDLRIFDRTGDFDLQTELRLQTDKEIARLIPELADSRPALWVTYHNFYKAPDLIGPAVCAALNLPYIQIESTRATSRLTGPWAGFAHSAEAATDAADLVFYLTEYDRETLERDRPAGQILHHLRPFLPRDDLPRAGACESPDRPMLTAAMMREGDKLASYEIIADALAHLPEINWHLNIAGDGPARPQVAELMKPFGNKVHFLGQLNRSEMTRAYQDAALFLWPGVNEAFGMVYLEAQAAGLPIAAQNRQGIRDVLLPADYPAPGDGPTALAAQIAQLLTTPSLRRRRGDDARKMVSQNHLIDSARATFWSAATPLIEVHT